MQHAVQGRSGARMATTITCQPPASGAPHRAAPLRRSNRTAGTRECQLQDKASKTLFVCAANDANATQSNLTEQAEEALRKGPGRRLLADLPKGLAGPAQQSVRLHGREGEYVRKHT